MDTVSCNWFLNGFNISSFVLKAKVYVCIVTSIQSILMLGAVSYTILYVYIYIYVFVCVFTYDSQIVEKDDA